MRKSLAALGLVAITCAACASGHNGDPGGSGGSPPVGPQLFVSPYGEIFRSEPGEPYPVAAWFAGADTDHDERLSKAEFLADGGRWFGILDSNGDGVIGQAEIAAYETLAGQTTGGMRGPGGVGMGASGMGRPVGGRAGPPGGSQHGGMSLADSGQSQDGGMGGMPGGGMGGPGGGRDGPGDADDTPRRSGPRGGGATSVLAMAGLLNVPEPVKAADVDTNQRITPEEWSRAGDRWFQLLDTNKDGALTLAELPPTQMQQRGGRGPGRGGPPR